jgi:predicted Rossmann-fold nucleotide-binding protein
MNVEGYFTPLLELIDHGVQEGFILSSHRRLVMDSQEAESLVSAMTNYSPDLALDKWVD